MTSRVPQSWSHGTWWEGCCSQGGRGGRGTRQRLFSLATLTSHSSRSLWQHPAVPTVSLGGLTSVITLDIAELFLGSSSHSKHAFKFAAQARAEQDFSGRRKAAVVLLQACLLAGWQGVVAGRWENSAQKPTGISSWKAFSYLRHWAQSRSPGSENSC